jgi:hypothetical protein
MKIKIVDIISIILILTAAALFLYLIVFYQIYSPEFVTHEQFYSAMAVVATAFFSGMLGVWMNISNRLTEFAGELGEMKGTLKQFISNHHGKRKLFSECK